MEVARQAKRTWTPEDRRRYYLEHSDREKERSQEYRKKNKASLQDYQRRYRQANKEKLALASQRYRAANREKIAKARK